MTARAQRRAAERKRLDLLAAEAHADEVDPDGYGTDRDWITADYLAGVAFERQRTRLVWRRRAPEWLQVTALTAVAALTVAALWLMVVAIAHLP